MSRAFVVALSAVVACALSCSRDPEPAAAAEGALWDQVQRDPERERGRVVFVANCKRCHGFGIEGAPRVGDPEAWRTRREKGEAALVRSVIEGVQGKSGGEMPPRGGNADLTDGEIAAAVQFIVNASP